jgi:SagB-type dehydrogenase family enzyme
MTNFLFEDFHRKSKYVHDSKPEQMEEGPVSTKEEQVAIIKTYGRFPRIKLPSKNPKDKLFAKQATDATPGMEEISLILFAASLERKGLALNIESSLCLETYLLLPKSVRSLDAGLYHYRPDLHELECVYNYQDWKEKEKLTLAIINSKALVIITGVFSRLPVEHKERGYRHLLLEAGALGREMQNSAHMMGILSVGLKGTEDVFLESFLDIDGVSESVVNTVVFG